MIVLENRGEIELDLIKTMGVNVKDCDSPIGYFGTGLKYAIAVFLREGIELEIYIGENQYDFCTELKEIRGKEFQFCMMRGKYDFSPLGFTTDLGKNWEVWQAYRELHSNCLDESGEVYKANTGKPKLKKGYTTIVLHHDIKIGDVFYQAASEPVYSDSNIEIYGEQSNHIYYKGIRAKDLSKPSVYTYNILKNCTLTEDRLLAYDFRIEEIINDAVAQMEDKGVIRNVINAGSNTYEKGLSMGYNSTKPPGKVFIEEVTANRETANYSALSFVENHLPKPVKKKEIQDFISEIDSLVDDYDLSYENDGKLLTIRLAIEN